MTQISHVPFEENTVHSIYEEFVKDNLFLIKWEFTPEYTEENKDLNYTFYHWKNTETNEYIQTTLDYNNHQLPENRVTFNEFFSYKDIFLFSRVNSKKDFINNNYWNNIFNFFYKKDGFYTINEQNENYIKIKILDNVCEIIGGNTNNTSPITLEQKIELDVVTDEDVEKIEVK